ncbi:MAG: hypothetical protein PHG85_04470 [Candidatus Altiarchaeota archaeon]|nr:hypothetical protein [Candidatus Altiarchaeota archaeon]
MKSLGMEYRPPADDIERRVADLVSQLEVGDFDRDAFRGIVNKDFGIKPVSPGTPPSISLLAADSSTASHNLRYSALWSIHCVCLYALFNGHGNEDPLVGHGAIPYGSVLYDSSADVGSFDPYWMLEQQMGCIRIAREYNDLAENAGRLAREGVPVDIALVDGSLSTNSENISFKPDLKASRSAIAAEERLLSLGRVVSMAEDSHASDIARRMGLNMSNLMLFHLVLDANEYVVERGRFNVCYVKLPGKKVRYLGDVCPPVTTRWEFSYPGFERDLSALAGIWMAEDDIIHPQVYPLRIADYLTRRLKAGGIIDKVVREMQPDLAFREMRESYFD